MTASTAASMPWKERAVDDLSRLRVEIAIHRQVLQRAAAAFTIMAAAARARPIRGRRDDTSTTLRAIALELAFDGFAGQRQRHEDLAAFMFGDAVALRAKAQDGEL